MAPGLGSLATSMHSFQNVWEAEWALLQGVGQRSLQRLGPRTVVSQGLEVEKERGSGRAGKIPSRNARMATGKVSHWVKVLPVKTDHLNSVLKTHMVKRPDSCKLWS